MGDTVRTPRSPKSIVSEVINDDEQGKIAGRNLLVPASPRDGGEFDCLVGKVSVPLLRRFGVDVVNYGPSLHEPDAYVLIRAYSSLEDRAASQAAFYGSEAVAWSPGGDPFSDRR